MCIIYIGVATKKFTVWLFMSRLNYSFLLSAFFLKSKSVVHYRIYISDMRFFFQASDSSGIEDAMSNRDTNAITPMHAAAVNGDKSSLVKLIAGV